MPTGTVSLDFKAGSVRGLEEGRDLEFLFSLGRELTPDGGGLALVFILSLILCIVGLAGLYLVSAVAVLERFARVSRRPISRIVMGIATSGLMAAFQIAISKPELADESLAVWLSEWSRILPWAAGGVTLAMISVHAFFKSLAFERAARFILLAAGGSLAAWLGGEESLLLSLGLALPPALVSSGLVLLRRSRRNRSELSTLERDLLRLSLVLALGALVSLLPAGARSVASLSGGWGLTILGGGVLLGLLPLAGAGFLDMRGSAEWFIAIRYLTARRRQVFISAISAICVLGIAAGVWLILVVLSVMNGFEQTWREEILGHRAHFVLKHAEGPFPDHASILGRVERVPGVVGASPFVDADGMVRASSGEIFSIRLRGIDPSRAASVNRLADGMLSGSLDALELSKGSIEERQEGPRDPGIVVGSRLAAASGLGLGDEVVVISPFGGPPTPLGPAPRLKRFQIVGIFRGAFHQYDESYAYVSIPEAQKFRRVGDVIDGIEAVTTDHYRSGRVGDEVVAALGPPFETQDWKEFFPAFFQALKTERIMMSLLLTMIMVVAGFVTVSTLIMMIMEKTRDIAILKAMGAKDALVERIFALEGVMIGLAGTLVGLLGALAVGQRLSWIQDQIQRWTGVDALPTALYQFSGLPSRVDLLQVGVVILIAMILSLGSTWLPSRQAARVDPAEGLHHE